LSLCLWINLTLVILLGLLGSLQRNFNAFCSIWRSVRKFIIGSIISPTNFKFYKCLGECYGVVGSCVVLGPTNSFFVNKCFLGFIFLMWLNL
jgi:hypothetical protein